MLGRKKRRGAAAIKAIAACYLIMIFALFFLGILEMYDTQYSIDVRAQRAINTTVEYSMDDTWRADGYNFMDVDVAKATLINNLNTDLKVDSYGNCKSPSGKTIYHVDYGIPTYTSGYPSGTASITIPITITMSDGISASFGVSKRSWTSIFQSTNFRTDDNERAGEPLS